jgi:hypothetical protein
MRTSPIRRLAAPPTRWVIRRCASGDDHHAGHVAALARAAHRAQVDLRQAGHDSSRCSRGSLSIGRVDGEENPTLGYTRIKVHSRTSGTASARQRLPGSSQFRPCTRSQRIT